MVGLSIEQVDRHGRTLRIYACVTAQGARRPDCADSSIRVHSRYQRCLSDATVGGAEMLICLQVRRFYCHDSGCARTTFAEQAPGLTTAYARRTLLLRGILERIAFVTGRRPGERLTHRLAVAVTVSQLTPLRLILHCPSLNPVR